MREGYWFGSKDLWFTGIYNYIKNLNAGIRLRNEEDKIMWSWNKTNGQITAREAYSSIVQVFFVCNIKWWSSKLWKLRLP